MKIPAQRQGARRRAEIPPDIQQAINRGQIATVNLVEFLAADLQQLLPAVAGQIGLDPQHSQITAAVDRLPSLKTMQRHALAAQALWLAGDSSSHQKLASHGSDLARQWAALQIGQQQPLSLPERLEKIRPLAADPHFNVREFAWMALRPAITAELALALNLLQSWVQEEDANLRRFACELTRPRGVWCLHIAELKTRPESARPLLEALRADPSRYVQNSLGNWLNDAAKSQPAWVRQLCQGWPQQNRATQYICRRALRNLDLEQTKRISLQNRGLSE